MTRVFLVLKIEGATSDIKLGKKPTNITEYPIVWPKCYHGISEILFFIIT